MKSRLIEIIIVLIFLTLALLSYEDVFTPIYVHTSFITRHPLVDSNLPPNKTGIINVGKDLTSLDWMSNVEYKVKGAFVADNKIAVRICFTINNPRMLDQYKDHVLQFVFLNAIQDDKTPSQSIVPEGAAFIQKIIGEKTVFEGKILYTMPGNYGYSILIVDPKDLTKKEFDVTTRNQISIAAPEINTQIRSNNIMLSLGFIGIMIALLQLVSSFRK
jgi:hypothetical protein